MQDFKDIEKIVKFVQSLSDDPIHQKTLLGNAAHYIDSMVQSESQRQILGQVIQKIKGN